MIYINVKNGSSKFWGYESFRSPVGEPYYKYWHVITYWGRIGKSLDECQSKEFDFKHEWESREFIRIKLREKRKKGYTVLEKSYKDFIKTPNKEISKKITRSTVTEASINGNIYNIKDKIAI